MKKFKMPDDGAAAPIAETVTVEEVKADKTNFDDNPLGPILTDAIEEQPKIRKKHTHEKKRMDETKAQGRDSANAATENSEKEQRSGGVVLAVVGVAAAVGLFLISGGRSR